MLVAARQLRPRLHACASARSLATVPEFFATHDVTNQPPPLENVNLFTSDTALREAVARERAGWAEQRLSAFGAICGSADFVELAEQANANPPQLLTHDRYGRRVDVAKYHPAYHTLMRTAIEHEVHCLPYTCGQAAGGFVARAALSYMLCVDVMRAGCEPRSPRGRAAAGT